MSETGLSASESFLATLRTRTRPYHDKLELTVDIPWRCNSLAGYRDLLERFYGFYAPLEAVMAQQAEWQRLNLADRLKTPLLRRDLAALGAPSVETLPLCDALPAVDTLGGLLGTAYVLEGATLGGQVILRLVETGLGIGADTGCAFFHSYGPEIGRKWRTFRGLLTELAADPVTQEAVIKAAGDTFGAPDDWLHVPAQRYVRRATP